MSQEIVNSNKITILLDIDGVLVINPSWSTTTELEDGFFEFNKNAAENIAKVVKGNDVVLISSHRHLFTPEKWIEIFKNRGIEFDSLTIAPENSSLIERRIDTITKWVLRNHKDVYKWVVIDDDTSLHGMTDFLKKNSIIPKSMIGFDSECLKRYYEIIQE